MKAGKNDKRQKEARNYGKEAENSGFQILKFMYLRLSPYMKNFNRGFDGFQFRAAVEFRWDIDLERL